MLKKTFLAVALAVIAGTFAATAAVAQDWKAEWDKTVAAAKGSKLNLVIQPDPGFEAIVEVFKKKYPDIRVEASAVNPSAFAPRLVTEQNSGLFAWDVWWSSASNMTIVNIPAGSLAPIPNYLILPEVKDESNWHNPKYLYTSDKGPFVFVHTHYLQNLGYYNTDLVPGGEIKTIRDLANPALKGKFALRAPDRPHGGSQMLAQALKMTDEAFLNTLFTTMSPIIVDNARQVTDGVIRGDYAYGIGTDDNVWMDCVKAGGCKNVKQVPFSFMHSRAISIPKNPPNPAAAKVFVNWLLSKEGQEVYVKEWAKVDSVGAFSMRKDVAPDPAHKGSLPDFNNLDQYVAVSLDSGVPYISKVAELFNKSRAK